MARDPQNFHGTALLSQCPQDAPQHLQPSLFALSLLRSYKGLTVGDQTKATSILLLSQLPRRLPCRHGLRIKRAVFGSRCGRPRAQLVSSLFHHHTSSSLRLLPGHTRVKDTPLLFRLLSARCSRGISTQNILAPVPPAFLIRPLPHLPLGNLSPIVSPGTPSIYHTGIELRRHACRRLPPVPPPAGLLLWVYF